MPTFSLREEIDVAISFLCERDHRIFRRLGEWDTVEILDPREAVILASLVPDSFFLRRIQDGSELLEPFHVQLSLAFADDWVTDLQAKYHEIFGRRKKIVKFVEHWDRMWETDPANSRRRKRKTLGELDQYLKDCDLEPGECLFVPYKEYRSGFQLGELVYHYLLGCLFREKGYLVLTEYPLSEYHSRKTPRPDICAFKTSEIENILTQLRNRGIIGGGAFLQELQLFTLFGKQRYKARRQDSLELSTEAEAVVVEIERRQNQVKGRSQLEMYLLQTQGLFDEGYLAGPFLERTKGTITLSSQGRVIFEEADPAFRPDPLPNHLMDARRRQLEKVRADGLIQLFKNLPLRRIVEICERQYPERELESYEGLLDSMISSDLEQLLDTVVSLTK